MDYIWGQSISLPLPGGEGLDGGSLGWRGGSWMNQGPSHTSFLLSPLGWRRARPRWALGGERNPGGAYTSICYGFMTIPGCYIFMNDSFFSRSEIFFEIKGVHSFFNVAIQDCFIAVRGVGT